MAKQLMLPANRAFDSNGLAIPGATASLYLSGTLTPANFYADSGLVTSLGPTITANGAGRFDINAYGDETIPYRLITRDALGAELDDIDPFYFGSTVWGTLTAASGVSVGSRALLAAVVSPANGQSATLTESGREGPFIFLTTAAYNTLTGRTLTADVMLDTLQGVIVPPSSDTTGASGAWVRRGQVLTPFMFGAKGDEVTDDAAALNAFAAWVCATRVPHNMDGLYAVGSGVTFNPGTFGITTSFAINVGNTRITALNAISKLFSLVNAYNVKVTGRLHLRGTNYLSDSAALWTCDVAFYLNNAGLLNVDHLYMEGFGYAGVHSEGVSDPNNDSCHFGHVQGVRIGSGQPTSSRNISANWTAGARVGIYGSLSQTVPLTVDTLPIAYMQGVDVNSAPFYNLFVEVNGNLHRVMTMDTVGKVLQVFPWLPGSPASGTLKYHYGGAVALRGSDSNIDHFDYISANGCSTGIEMAALYGSVVGICHTETCGSNMRLGGGGNSTMWGGHVAMRYCEGNTFNMVHASQGVVQFYVCASPASTPITKDISCAVSLTSSEVYGQGEGFQGLSLPASGSGVFYRKKRFVDIASEALDFTDARVFDYPTFFTANTASFTLVAPDSGYRMHFGLDCAQVSVMGSGGNGQPTGTITFTVPTTAVASCVVNSTTTVTMPSTAGILVGMPVTGTGIPVSTTVSAVNNSTTITLSAAATVSATETLTFTNSINGAFANLVFPANSFNQPATLKIYYNGLNAWTIKGNQALSGTATFDPPSLATGASTAIQTMTVTGAIIGDGVNMSFSNSLAGARLTGWVSATNTVSYYFTNDAGTNPLDLASGTVTARIIR